MECLSIYAMFLFPFSNQLHRSFIISHRNDSLIFLIQPSSMSQSPYTFRVLRLYFILWNFLFLDSPLLHLSRISILSFHQVTIPLFTFSYCSSLPTLSIYLKHFQEFCWMFLQAIPIHDLSAQHFQEATALELNSILLDNCEHWIFFYNVCRLSPHFF